MKYFATWTQLGLAKRAEALATKTQINFKAMALGDGGGVAVLPNILQAALVREVHRQDLNEFGLEPNNPNYVYFKIVVPETIGGFVVRELGLYDDEGYLLAVANTPESYKPQMSEGSAAQSSYKIILVETNTEVIKVEIDTSTVLATQSYIYKHFAEIEHTHTAEDITDLADFIKNSYKTSNTVSDGYSSGWRLEPDGHLTQWGRGISSTTGIAAINFHVAFSEVPYFVSITDDSGVVAGVNPVGVLNGSLTKTGCTVLVGDTSLGPRSWFFWEIKGKA